MKVEYQYNNGGRKDAGFTGETRDCVCRAIAIATDQPYKEVYDTLNVMCKAKNKKWSSRVGVGRKVYEKYLTDLGWKWTAVMLIGSGCRMHLVDDELPTGRLICRLSKHIVAVINGVVHDTSDPRREGTRCVYGYFSPDI